jgi:hypothetical protein
MLEEVNVAYFKVLSWHFLGKDLGNPRNTSVSVVDVQAENRTSPSTEHRSEEFAPG